MCQPPWRCKSPTTVLETDRAQRASSSREVPSRRRAQPRRGTLLRRGWWGTRRHRTPATTASWRHELYRVMARCRSMWRGERLSLVRSAAGRRQPACGRCYSAGRTPGGRALDRSGRAFDGWRRAPGLRCRRHRWLAAVGQRLKCRDGPRRRPTRHRDRMPSRRVLQLPASARTRPRQAALGRRADLGLAAASSAPAHPLGTPPRAPRGLPAPRLRVHLPALPARFVKEDFKAVSDDRELDAMVHSDHEVELDGNFDDVGLPDDFDRFGDGTTWGSRGGAQNRGHRRRCGSGSAHDSAVEQFGRRLIGINPGRTTHLVDKRVELNHRRLQGGMVVIVVGRAAERRYGAPRSSRRSAAVKR